MGLTLIERYVFKKALIALLTVSGALIGVIWVVRAVQEVDVILNKGQGILTYLQMTTLGVPTLAAAIAPLALLIALLQVINNLNSDSELVVMHASGASRMSLLKPFLVLSILTAMVVYALALYAGPQSMQKLRGLITQVRADLISVIVREGQFREIGDGLTFHVAERAPGGRLRGILILDSRDDKETLTYLAQDGIVSSLGAKTFLILQNGEIQRVDRESQSISVIEYESYAYDLSGFSGNRSSHITSQSEIPTRQLFAPDPNEKLYQAFPERYRAEFHKRFAVGLYPIVVGLVVLAFVGNPNTSRQGQGLAVAGTVGLIVALRAGAIVAEGGLRSSISAAFLVWGIPIVAILAASMFLATDRSPLPRQMQARMVAHADRIWLRIRPALLKLWRRPASSAGQA
ncbi:MAG: LPS export ABC transporter permease LptF [Ahrensia sp.]|nr:LPS export ABC transporter permease LptF [Ahrensia sp.]